MKVTAVHRKLVAKMVDLYTPQREKFERATLALERLLSDSRLRPYTHSLKARTKDPEHLSAKLIRKIEESSVEKPFTVTLENFFARVNDLAGARLIHLHTHQVFEIDPVLKQLLDEERIVIVEGPVAKTWDEEHRRLYGSRGFACETNPRMYSSVHYVVRMNHKDDLTAEIQVRTLADELWGEVDHAVNYPEPLRDMEEVADQIRALARFTTGCSRLVDSIMLGVKKRTS